MLRTITIVSVLFLTLGGTVLAALPQADNRPVSMTEILINSGWKEAKAEASDYGENDNLYDYGSSDYYSGYSASYYDFEDFNCPNPIRLPRMPLYNGDGRIVAYSNPTHVCENTFSPELAIAILYGISHYDAPSAIPSPLFLFGDSNQN